MISIKDRRQSVTLLHVIMFFLLLVTGGCKVNYSFTGGDTGDAKTINIKYFQNNATIVVPTLSQQLTEALRDKFTSETSLVLVNQKSDLILEGSITGYQTQPVAISGNDQAQLNRLTITVDVTYTNTLEEDKSFQSKFSRYSDYSSDKSLTSVEEELIAEINTMIVEDIFNKAVINW
ncbi:MAG: LptE family protein [Bacteroidales bacterium]|nr:LptE family protein [Bacteroidales bacterium]